MSVASISQSCIPRTLEALRSLDFLCVAAHTMTPTAAVADLVLPKTTTLEEEEVDVSQTGACVTYTAPASTRIGEVRCDMEIASGLVARMRDRGALTAELLPWTNQADLNRFLIGDAPIDQSPCAGTASSNFHTNSEISLLRFSRRQVAKLNSTQARSRISGSIPCLITSRRFTSAQRRW